MPIPPVAATSVTLILYSRSYCHLCDEMRDALIALTPYYGFSLRVMDVDATPALVALYDELVPVLTTVLPDGTEQQICHYFLDKDQLRQFCPVLRTE